MSFYLSDKDYKEMIGIISGNTDGKKGNDAGGTYIDMPSTNAEPKQQGIVADTVDAVQMGAWKGVSDIAHGLGALTGADWLHKVGDWAAEGADENLATMSDEMKVALNQNAFDGEDQGIRNARWWAGNLGSLIGQNLDTVLTLGAGKAATFGVKQAGKMLLKKEAAEEVGKVAVEQAAKRGIPQKYWNMIGITATMSAMSGGSRYSQKRDDVMAMTNEQLSQIPQFSDAYYEIADSEEGKDKSVEEIYSMAKSRFADKVGRDAALNPTAIATDLATNAVSGLGGGFWGLGSPAKTIKGGLLKGAMVEGGTEAIQGVGEQYALNKAEQDNYNPNKDLTEGMADNAINSAVLGGVFGSAMGGLDTYTDRRAFNNQKRILLNHINTGNEAIDSQLKNYVDMLNQGAADLGDLVSASRVQALNNAGIANARARQVEEDARAQQQASAQFESDFFGEEQVAQPNQPEFTIDPQMERAVYVAKAIEKFRKGDLSGANEFISEPMVFADNQAKSQFVIGRSFDELKNIAQSYGLDPKDGKAMRQWIEDYIAKAREYNTNSTATSQTINSDHQSNLQPNIDSKNTNEQIAQDDLINAARYSFAGENAQTANKELLTQAKSAVENGRDPEAIRQETGWFKGADSKWRFELDDSEITFKTKNIAQSIKGGAKLGDLINAEKLFNAYPGLKDVAVKESQSGTYYSPRTNEIFFNTNESSNSIKGDLLHEVQHAIQRVENFATGGSPKQFSEKVIDRNKILSENEQHFASVSFNKLSAKGKEYARAINRGENVEENYRLLSNNPNDKANWADYLHRINSSNEYRQLGADLSVISPLEQYRQLAGEVEARNVQIRLPLTEAQRKASSPKDTQGIPDEQQQVRYGNGINLALNESANSDFAKAVEDVFGSTNTKVKAESIYLGTTPKALIESGLDDLPMFMNKQKLVKIKHEHPEMTADLLKQIPQQINNPVSVFKNTKEGSPNNSYVVLTELQGTNGNPVISAIHANKTERGLEFHRIASVYGRNESSNYITNMVKHSEVRFVDKQKARRINHTLQLLADDTLNELFDRASVVKSDGSVNTLNPEIQHAQDIIRKTFGKAAEHIEVTTFANPPKDVKNLITSDVEGWFNPKTGKITIVADSIKPTKAMTKDERLQFVAWHEMAHRGINVGYKGTYENLMSEVGKNKAVSQIADAIQNQRKGTDDLAATNRTVAIEEAIAEIMAANETGKWNELETRYGVEIKKGQRQSAKSWLAMTAQRIKEFLSKIFGVERVAQFSDDDVLNLVANIKKSAVGNFNESGNVRFSRNEDLTEERYNQAKENGETELTFHQWKQVRSPEFKAWFGDWENDPRNASKVINQETGEPLVVYHGTGREFNTFKKMKTTRGNFFTGETKEVESQAFFFSEDYDYSEHVSRVRANETMEVKPVFLNIRYLNKISDFADISEFTTDTEIDFMDKSIWTYFDDKEFTDKFREEYDGAEFEEDSGEVTYAVFNPNQIKSATDNTGSFSKENDDIRFSRKKLSESDERYLELANKYKDGDLSVEPELRAMVDSKANENGVGKPDYRMEHSAPNGSDEISQSIDNLKGLYPDDLYSNKGYQYYGSGYDSMDRQAWEVLKRVKGNPDAKVTIYRAYPKGTGSTITNGDWVTIVRDYAVEHGEANLDGDYQIVSKDVKAKEIFTNADSLLEQGYDNGLSEVVNDKKKIKLDELITYDDDGNIIPLSKRFNPRKNDVRFSRANTMQSALDLAMIGVAHSEPTVWDSLKAKDFTGFKERFNRAVGKVDEWLADSLRPVNDWIDAIHLEDQTGSTSSRDHEKRRLKDAMYTAKGKRDAINSELEQVYLKPILSKIAALSKETKKGKNPIDELTMKRMVGNWISARYSIEKNMDLLRADEKAMRDTKRLLDSAKQNGSMAEINRLGNAYAKAKEQYENRKADIYNTDYKNKGNRFKVGVAGGWSIPEAELILKNTEQRISKSDLESVAEMVYDLNQARLEIDRASGRYTEKEYQEYKANRHYVPLTGDPNADVDTDIISGASSSAVNIGRDKTLKGRTSSEAEDAIDAMWKSVGKSTTYAGFAEFKGKIDDLYETEVTMLKEKGYSDSQAREQATANLGISKRKMQGLTRSSDNVLIRKEGGEYYEYELPKQAMEALRNDNVEHANAFLKLISKPTGWYARGVTQWTLMFAPGNMMRDTWEKSEFIRVQKLYDKNNRLVDSKTMDKIGRATIANAFTDKEVWQATKRLGFGQELRDSVPAERMLKQLLKEGGVSNYGTYLDKSEVDLIKRLKKENNPIAGKLEKAGKILEGYNKMFDTVSALAAYKALVENGIDSKQAAATTLELTNFRKTGSKMRGIKALYMFSQPTVMGAANLIRYLSTRKGQIRFAAYLAGMTALYTVLRSMDDEDEGGNKMDQLGDITRYIPIPIGGGHYFKIPVGFGMPQMAWNFSTNIVKGAVSDISLTEAGANMLVHSLKTFSPVSPSEISAAKYPMEKLTLTATPTILQPLMQNVLNRSAFGNKITTNFVRDDKLKAEQSKATTAQFWKDVALSLNDNLGIDMHPEQIKNLFDGYSSVFGSLKELNTVFIENPNREQLGRNTRMPFINQFIGTTNEFSIQSRYYEASEEARKVATEYESRKNRGALDGWLDDDKRKLIRFYEQDKSTTQTMRSEKAKLTRALRSGQISAVTYENGIKRYNKDMSRTQAQILRKYRLMEGLNTN